MSQDAGPQVPDQVLIHWNWRSGEAKILAKGDPVPHLAVPADGKRFATTEGEDGKGNNEAPVGTRRLRIWKGEDGTEIARVPLDFDPSALAFSTDGRHVAVGERSQVLLLRAADGGEVARFGVPSSPIDPEKRITMEILPGGAGSVSLGFAAQGQMLVIKETSGALLFDIPTRSSWHLRDPEAISKIAISADGAFLAMQGNRLLSVWDVGTREPLIRFEAPGISNLIFAGQSGRELLAVRNGKIARLLWQPEELKQLACEAFADGDWRRGRARIIGESGPHPCD